jgi:NAD(P)-dependent dehydrogenase (short-subunit alcohol dehydrogenase family)
LWCSMSTPTPRRAAARTAGPGLAADVANLVQVEPAFNAVVESCDRIDVQVNNAGITGSQAATICHEPPVEPVVAVTARGPFLCSRAVLPVMLAQGSGHMITVASVAGQVAFPGRCAYTASKGTVLMLARSIAVDYARMRSALGSSTPR